MKPCIKDQVKPGQDIWSTDRNNLQLNSSTPNNIRHLQIKSSGQNSASKLSSFFHLSAAKLQFHFVQENWKKPSFHFSIHATYSVFWFLSWCGAAVNCSRVSAYRQNNMILSVVRANAWTVAGFRRRNIDPVHVAQHCLHGQTSLDSFQKDSLFVWWTR